MVPEAGTRARNSGALKRGWTLEKGGITGLKGRGIKLQKLANTSTHQKSKKKKKERDNIRAKKKKSNKRGKNERNRCKYTGKGRLGFKETFT